MIHTRKTIFKTLLKRIRELTKHANPAPKEFKKILLAVILNDLKEWSEYIPKDDPFAIDKMLLELLRDNCFIIERFNNLNMSYVNVNTPLTNTTWQRIWDKPSSNFVEPEKQDPVCKPWDPDPDCEVKLIYFYLPEGKTPKVYLEDTYGIYGEKLKTICDKMNIYIDRETGSAWYLDNQDCTWKPVGNKQTWTEQEILDTVRENLKIKHDQSGELGDGIYADLSETKSPIEFCSNEDMEGLV